MDEFSTIECDKKNTTLTLDDEMVLQVVREYDNCYIDPEDLIGEGYLGLSMAYAEYRKEEINIPFSLLAVRLIRQCIEGFIERDKNWHLVDRLTMEINPDTLADEPSLLDNYFENLDEAIYIYKIFNALSYRSREILLNYLGIGLYNPYSLEDIGDIFALSRERVRQIKDTAITRLNLLSHQYKHFRNPSPSSLILLLNSFFFPDMSKMALYFTEKFII